MSERTKLSADEILNRYFLESRARLLDIAAFLDRIDRAPGAEQTRQDFRYRALMGGIFQLLEADGPRAQAILQGLSDQTAEPVPAAGEASAHGAFAGALP